jgi:hypothetical protein
LKESVGVIIKVSRDAILPSIATETTMQHLLVAYFLGIEILKRYKNIDRTEPNRGRLVSTN